MASQREFCSAEAFRGQNIGETCVSSVHRLHVGGKQNSTFYQILKHLYAPLQAQLDSVTADVVYVSVI